MLDNAGAKELFRGMLLDWFGRASHIRRRRKSNPRSGPPRSILLIRPDHLGDLLFVTPSLTLLRRAFPEAKITCLVGPWAREVIANNGDIDEVLTCDFPWFNRRPRRSLREPYVTLHQTAADLSRREFDVAVNLRFDFWWGALLADLAGIPEIVGYDMPSCRPFLTNSLPYVPRCHEVEQNLRLISMLLEKNDPLVWEARSYPLQFHPTEKDEKYVADLLYERLECSNGNLMAIHPGTGADVKLWTAEGFNVVTRSLVNQHEAHVLITGSSSERKLAESVARGLDDRYVHVLAGETSLGQLGALFRRCSVVVGVDSGPMHLAVGVGTPTVHLYGPSDTAAFGPYGDKSRHAIVASEMSCSPCGRLDITENELPEHQCMRMIESHRVLAAIEEVLKGAGSDL